MRITRLDVLTRLAEGFGYRSYLEVGVAGGATFRHLPIEDRTGVDPKWRLWYLLNPRVKKTTSDRFFARNRKKFDLIFIDGWHVAEQAWRDIENSLAALEDHGTIVVHDCSPDSEEQQRVPRIQVSWTGDVWRAFLKASQDPDLDTMLLDTNRGCGVIRKGGRRADNDSAPPVDIDPLDREELSYATFEQNRKEWLRIVPAQESLAAVDALAASGAHSLEMG